MLTPVRGPQPSPIPYRVPDSILSRPPPEAVSTQTPFVQRPNRVKPLGALGDGDLGIKHVTEADLTVEHSLKDAVPGDVDAIPRSLTLRVKVEVLEDDLRLPAIQECLHRLREVLAGRRVIWDARRSDDPTYTLARSKSFVLGVPPKPSGRPSEPRSGVVLYEGERSQFRNLKEAAILVETSRRAMTAKYLAICRDKGVDPDRHDGFDFRMKGREVIFNAVFPH